MRAILFASCLCLLLASCEPRDVIRDAPPEEPVLTLAEEEPAEPVQPVVCQLRVEVKAPEVDKYRDIPLSHELQDAALDACKEYGVLPDVLFAVMEVESGYQPDAKNGECYGLMQIHTINLPWLQEQIGTTDLSDPVQNIRAGAYILGGYLMAGMVENAKSSATAAQESAANAERSRQLAEEIQQNVATESNVIKERYEETLEAARQAAASAQSAKSSADTATAAINTVSTYAKDVEKWKNETSQLKESAETAAQNAAESAAAAAESAKTANEQATAASGSATAAEEAKTAAQTAETNAKASETAAQKAQAAAEEAIKHYPRIGEDNWWEVYNPTTGAYERTDSRAQLVPRGVYSPSETYQPLDVVTENPEATAAYLALKESTGVALSDTAAWFKLVGGIKGDKGDPGKDYEIAYRSLTLPAASWAADESTEDLYRQTVAQEDITALVEADKTALDLYADLATRRLLRDQDVLEIWLENQDGTVVAYAEGAQPQADVAVQVRVMQ